jgi:hypothetical protein
MVSSTPRNLLDAPQYALCTPLGTTENPPSTKYPLVPSEYPCEYTQVPPSARTPYSLEYPINTTLVPHLAQYHPVPTEDLPSTHRVRSAPPLVLAHMSW